MKAKAWLTLELRQQRRDVYSLHITGVRQSRPLDQLAIEVNLEVPKPVIWPQVEVLVESGQVQLELSPPEEEEEDDAATS